MIFDTAQLYAGVDWYSRSSLSGNGPTRCKLLVVAVQPRILNSAIAMIRRSESTDYIYETGSSSYVDDFAEKAVLRPSNTQYLPRPRNAPPPHMPSQYGPRREAGPRRDYQIAVSPRAGGPSIVRDGAIVIKLPSYLRKNYDAFKAHQQNSDSSLLLNAGLPGQCFSDVEFVQGSGHHAHRSRPAATRPAELETLFSKVNEDTPPSLRPRARPFAPTSATSEPLRYLRPIAQELDDFSEVQLAGSRPGILDELGIGMPTALYVTRLAFVGALGVGKSYLAMGCVHRLIERSTQASIVWLSADSDMELEFDCLEVARMLGVTLSPTTQSWDHVCECIVYLGRRVTSPCLIVLDGVDSDRTDSAGINKLRSGQTGVNCSIVLTTRDSSIAELFAPEDRYTLGRFTPEYAAGVLGLSSDIVTNSSFAAIATLVEGDPYVTMRVRNFLACTKMPSEEYAAGVACLLEDYNWQRHGPASTAAQALWGVTGLSRAASGGPTCSALVAILRSCTNPSWQHIFEDLAEHHPDACDLLSLISVFGLYQRPGALSIPCAGRMALADFLINKHFVQVDEGGISCSRIMVIAHRCWLLGRGRMEATYRMALKVIANYCAGPMDDAADHRYVENAIATVLSDNAQSWLAMDAADRRNISVIEQTTSSGVSHP